MAGSRKIQNAAVILAAVAAAAGAVRMNTDWLSKKADRVAARERCYGVVRAGFNDCANAAHSCATQAKTSASPDEWIQIPHGLCDRLAHGRKEES